MTHYKISAELDDILGATSARLFRFRSGMFKWGCGSLSKLYNAFKSYLNVKNVFQESNKIYKKVGVLT